jgi:hypothetical protein
MVYYSKEMIIDVALGKRSSRNLMMVISKRYAKNILEIFWKLTPKIIPKPVLDQTYGFKNEAAEPIEIGEHSRDSQNSYVSFKRGNGIRLSFFLHLE